MVRLATAFEPRQRQCHHKESDKELVTASGEFFTPLSIVKLIVEIIEPSQSRIDDPASDSVGAVKRVAKLNLSFTPEYMLK
jgi:type I restriction-modification system DNA methylase subunit